MRHGRWGGELWSDGRLWQPGERFGPTDKTGRAEDALDELFKNHDIAYDAAEDAANAMQRAIDADYFGSSNVFFNSGQYAEKGRKYHREANIQADRLAIPAGPTPGINDARDAFRHAYASSRFAEEFASTRSWILGDANELAADLRRSRRQTSNMDRWNNAKRRELAENNPSSNENERGDKVKALMDSGSLDR